MFYINQNIPCKKIETFQFTFSIEILTLEINLGKEKLLIFGTYKPPNINNNYIMFWYKRHILKNGINTLAYGHKDMM